MLDLIVFFLHHLRSLIPLTDLEIGYNRQCQRLFLFNLFNVSICMKLLIVLVFRLSTWRGLEDAATQVDL